MYFQLTSTKFKIIIISLLFIILIFKIIYNKNLFDKYISSSIDKHESNPVLINFFQKIEKEFFIFKNE